MPAASASAFQDNYQIARPGNGLADGRRIPEYQNTLVQTRRHHDGRREDIGVWNDEVRFEHHAGRSTLFRTQSADCFEQESWHQEIRVCADTLAPMSVIIHSGERLHNRVLHEGHVIHTTRRMWPEGDPTGGPVTVDMVLTPPEPIFEWQLWELTLAAFDLQPGFACRFLAHHVQVNATSPLIRIAFVVTGSEKVHTEHDGVIDCWKVELTADNPWTVWIAKDRSIAPVVAAHIRNDGYTDIWERG